MRPNSPPMPITTAPTLPGALRQARRDRKLTLHGLATLSGLDRSYLGRIEQQGRHASDYTLLVIAQALAMTDTETDLLLAAGGYAPRTVAGALALAAQLEAARHPIPPIGGYYNGTP